MSASPETTSPPSTSGRKPRPSSRDKRLRHSPHSEKSLKRPPRERSAETGRGRVERRVSSGQRGWSDGSESSSSRLGGGLMRSMSSAAATPAKVSKLTFNSERKSASNSSQPNSSPRRKKGHQTPRNGRSSPINVFGSPHAINLSAPPELKDLTQVGNRQLPVSITLPQLISFVATKSADVTTTTNLIAAHGHFVPSTTFLSFIRAAFKASRSLAPELALPTQMRLVNLAKAWYSCDSTAITKDDALNKNFLKFVKLVQDSNETMGQLLESLIKGQQPSELPQSLVGDTFSKTKKTGVSPPPSPLRPEPKLAGDEYHLRDFSPVEIARQLCLIESEAMSHLTLAQFHHVAWTKGKNLPLERVSDFTNKFAYFLALQIVSADGARAQSKTWVHVVKIGTALIELQNYNSLLALYIALEHPLVLALDLKKEASKKMCAAYEIVKAIMSPIQNFAGYRARISTINAPYIPCAEVHLKDLLYHTEALSDYTLPPSTSASDSTANSDSHSHSPPRSKPASRSSSTPPPKAINFIKMDTMGGIISYFFNSLALPYNFRVEQTIYRTISIPGLTLDEIKSRLDSYSAVSEIVTESLQEQLGSQDLDQLASSLQEREEALDQREAELEERELLLDIREAELAKREKKAGLFSVVTRKKKTPTSRSAAKAKDDRSRSPASGRKSKEFAPRSKSAPPRKLILNDVYSILLIGLSGSGRSALISRLCTNTFLPTSYSKDDEVSPVIARDGKKMKLDNPLYDGSVSLDSYLSRATYDGFVLVYDVTDDESFTELTYWVEASKKLRVTTPAIVVGNRCDDKTHMEVDPAKGNKFAEKISTKHFVVSAKTGENVDAAFSCLLNLM
eukprot:TRINITY_DN1976_c0_g1_i1.p1 TRINITY_DN1976_c0_g1~~TRINITY_DN1976_c0_g1_i1.p1  ORF type:complete len:851 (+),score=151.59 TRINITY_DN1976_c0_g1_i1:60-2612(+)